MLAAIMLMSLLPAGRALAKDGRTFDDLPFTDLELPDEPEPLRTWYCGYLSRAVKLGLFAGTSGTTFSPERYLTRAEAVTVLAHLYEAAVGGKVEKGHPTGFSDVPAGSWYEDNVAWAHMNGLIAGVGPGRFAPDKRVTNSELAVIFHNYLQVMGGAGLYEPVDGAFAGEDKLPGWAREHVKALSGFGIFERDSFASDGFVSRANGTELFVRLYEKATYPVDNETPRAKYRYFAKLDAETGLPAYGSPLGDEHRKVLRSYGEYEELIARLQDCAESCEKIGQPSQPEISDALFEESNVLAFEVLERGAPAFDCEFAGVGISGSLAQVTLTESGFGGSTADTVGVLFLIVVPKDVTSVQVTPLAWTGRVDLTPA